MADSMPSERQPKKETGLPSNTRMLSQAIPKSGFGGVIGVSQSDVKCPWCSFHGDTDALTFHVNSDHFTDDSNNANQVNHRQSQHQQKIKPETVAKNNSSTKPSTQSPPQRAVRGHVQSVMKQEHPNHGHRHQSQQVQITNAHSRPIVRKYRRIQNRPIHRSQRSTTNIPQSTNSLRPISNAPPNIPYTISNANTVSTPTSGTTGTTPNVPVVINNNGACKIGAAEILNKLLAQDSDTDNWLKNSQCAHLERRLKTEDAVAQKVLDQLLLRDPDQYAPKIDKIKNEYHVSTSSMTLPAPKSQCTKPPSQISKHLPPLNLHHSASSTTMTPSDRPQSLLNSHSVKCKLTPQIQPIAPNSDTTFSTNSGLQQRAMTLDIDVIVNEEDDPEILMENRSKSRICGGTIGNIFTPQRHRDGNQYIVGQHLCFDDSEFSDLSPEELRYRDLSIAQSICNSMGQSVCNQSTSMTASTTSQCGQCHGLKRKLDEMSGLAREGPSFKRFMKDVQWAPPDSECHGVVRSAFVDRIRRAILDQPRYSKGKVFLIEANGYDEYDSNFKPNRNELRIIEKYIIKNHEGNINPSIRPKAAQRWMRLDEVIGTRKMAPCDWGSFLDGDSEAYAMVEIDKGVILGQYVGVEVTEEEWRTLFHGAKEETVNKKYLGGDTVRVPDVLRLRGDGNDGNGDNGNNAQKEIGKQPKQEKEMQEPPRKKRKMKQRNNSIESTESSSLSLQNSMDYSESSSSSLLDLGEQKRDDEEEEDRDVEPMPESVKLVYDPILAESKCPLMRINDCRANIRKEILEDEDIERINCEMISVLVNGWPTTLIRSTKRIEKDDALFFYYGAAYTEVMDSIDLIILQREKNYKAVTEILSDNVPPLCKPRHSLCNS